MSALPFSLNLRGLLVRRLATLLTIAGVSLMIMVFALSWAMDAGLRQVFDVGGDERLVLVMRQGSKAETTSWIPRDQLPVIAATEGIDQGPSQDPVDGGVGPMVAGELSIIINQPRRGSKDETANLLVRGVTPNAPALRRTFELVEGRMFVPGRNELIASKGIAQRFADCGLGETLVMRKTPYTIVGLFTAEGTPYESELWGDATDLGATHGRPGYSSVLVRISDPLARARFKSQVESDERLSSVVMGQPEYFALQTASAGPLSGLSFLLTLFLSIGACFAAANTMHASVLARSREIGTLRALGFARRSILACYVLESVVLALASALLGLVLAAIVLALQSGYAGTSNWTTFSEVAFRLAITPSVIATVLIVSLVIGVLGGFLPALRAARMPIIEALRN